MDCGPGELPGINEAVLLPDTGRPAVDAAQEGVVKGVAGAGLGILCSIP